MKRLKIMLLSLAVIVVVGSALAFKAKRTQSFCVLQTTGSSCATSQFCSTLVTGKKPTTSSGTKYCTTIVPANGCESDTPCGTANPVTLINNP